MTIVLVLSLFGGLVGAVEVGYRLGKPRFVNEPENKDTDRGFGAVDSSVFGVLGLILAFTFTGALGRFDERRELIVEEANAIGTAYLRLDLLPTESQEKLRPLFKNYVQSRVELYQNYGNSEIANLKYEQGLQLQNAIWQQATTLALSTGNPGIISLVSTSMNDMIDVTNLRLQATRTHPPNVVYFLLFTLALTSALLVGYNMSPNTTRSWYHIIIFTVVVSSTIYVILDIEYPRLGFIQIDIGDRVLIELLESLE